MEASKQKGIRTDQLTAGIHGQSNYKDQSQGEAGQSLQ